MKEPFKCLNSLEKPELYQIHSKIGSMCHGLCNPQNSINFYEKNIVVSYQEFGLKLWMVVVWVILLFLPAIWCLVVDWGVPGGVSYTLLFVAILVAIGLATCGSKTQTFVIPRNLITDIQIYQSNTFRCTQVTSSLRIGTLYNWKGYYSTICCIPYLSLGVSAGGIHVSLGDVNVDSKFLVEYLETTQSSSQELILTHALKQAQDSQDYLSKRTHPRSTCSTATNDMSKRGGQMPDDDFLRNDGVTEA